MPHASRLLQGLSLAATLGGLALATTTAHADEPVPTLATATIEVTVPTPVPAAPTATPAAKPKRGCAGADAMPSPANVATVRKATLCLLNRVRRSHHRVRLRNNPLLQSVAQRYSEQMVAAHFFDHVSPTGSTFVQRIRTTDYLARAASWSLGENLAWGSGPYATPRETLDAWMHSPGHRHNILEPRYREVGIGVATGTPTDVGGIAGATYTTEFGKRTRR